MEAIRTKQQAAQDAQRTIQDMLNVDMDTQLQLKWVEHTHNSKPLADLPPTIIEDYKKAVMAIPAKELKVMAARIKIIADRTEVKDLLFGEMSFILNALNSCPPSAYCKNFKEYLEKRETFDMITALYNEKFQSINEALEVRASNLRTIYMPKPDNGRSKFHA